MKDLEIRTVLTFAPRAFTQVIEAFYHSINSGESEDSFKEYKLLVKLSIKLNNYVSFDHDIEIELFRADVGLLIHVLSVSLNHYDNLSEMSEEDVDGKLIIINLIEILKTWQNENA